MAALSGRRRRARRAIAPPARPRAARRCAMSRSCAVPSPSRITAKRAPRAVGLLHLALEAAPGEVEVGARGRARAQLAGRARRRAARSLGGDDEGVVGPAPGGVAIASRIRSIPAAQPTAGVGGPAEQLDEPVVAAAAADPGLGAEPVAGELEDRARVVVEAADERAVERVGDARRRRAARGPRRSARRRRRRGGRASSARPPSPPGSRRGRSRRRASGSCRSARGPRRRAPPSCSRRYSRSSSR